MKKDAMKLLPNDEETQEDAKGNDKIDNFDYANYYSNCDFDPKKEILKEKQIRDFFKVRNDTGRSD